ncbi:M24 family metallopeptidase [Vulcanisaeta souniana]|uniref:Peptidase M24 n=1 Tax=Vulcanisaeta souniana JCM 11219 TaxID=1293586 RepID=A0A830E2P2_9CREN|nr:Xaa-Pro peptidase family protein [Vulcanisaeta souniana]BDR93396.1 peptidase M24 [Vulcanisaeta souniana JCM 11219]GGI76842.1 peptidase M24 [Vulcanisaeta souniana JCM 11219]
MIPRITEGELRHRINALREYMDRNELDAVYITNLPNIFYLTNLYILSTERPFILIVPRDGEITLISPLLEKDRLEFMERVMNSHVVGRRYFYFDFPGDPHVILLIRDWVMELARDYGIKSIGMDNPAGAPSYWGYYGPTLSELLQKTGIEVKPFRDVIENMRLTKNEEEINLIRISGEWAAKAIDIAMNYIRPGKYDWEVAFEASLEASRRLKEYFGDDYMTIKYPEPLDVGFRGQVGEYSAYPHIISIHRRISEGDVLGIGSGPDIGGYSAELERTLFVKYARDSHRDLYEKMMRIREAALMLIRPYGDIKEVDKAVREKAKELGVYEYLRHHVGHGLGIEGHERPFIDIGYEGKFLPGMVFSVEPGIYVPGLGGFRHSDTVLVRKDGIEFLTKYPVEINELIIK